MEGVPIGYLPGFVIRFEFCQVDRALRLHSILISGRLPITSFDADGASLDMPSGMKKYQKKNRSMWIMLPNFHVAWSNLRPSVAFSASLAKIREGKRSRSGNETSLVQLIPAEEMKIIRQKFGLILQNERIWNLKQRENQRRVAELLESLESTSESGSLCNYFERYDTPMLITNMQ